MAKDCDFADAMLLCRNWDEFADLHTPALWQYFPAFKWFAWSGNRMTEEVISRGCVPFFVDVTAEDLTTHNRMSRITQRTLAAKQIVIEARKIVCAYMKRNCAASRRFIQCMLLDRGELMILVRDGRTGKIVVVPDEDDRWLRRRIPGFMCPEPVLFDQSLPDHFPFIEITNPVHVLQNGGMLPSLLNDEANSLHKTLLPDKPVNADDAISDDEDSAWESDDGAGNNGARIWDAVRAKDPKVRAEKRALIRKLDFESVQLRIPISKLTKIMSSQEIMERDRSYIFKETFHLSDLETGAATKYDVSTRLVRSVQRFVPDTPKLDWPWFCIELLNWMNLRLRYKDCNVEPLKPWPHRYMAQDITQAFVTMALFFPNGSEFKSSPLFDPLERSKHRRYCRTRTRNRFRPASFWSEIEGLKAQSNNRKPMSELYPLEWSILARSTVAKLYRGGAPGPAPFSPEPQICPRYVIVNTEPHRPDGPDVSIQYNWKREDFMEGMPANYVDYADWPDLTSKIRPFATAHPNARFSLLKLWSAPRFYPIMLQTPSRLMTAFLGTADRAMEWKFLPKDMPASEWSIHNSVRLRLECLRQAIMSVSDAEIAAASQKAAAERRAKEEAEARVAAEIVAAAEAAEAAKMGGKKKKRREKEKKDKKSWWDKKYEREKAKNDADEKRRADEKWHYGQCELDERADHRGDLILVMGTDELDFLKWSTAVMFAIQAKPWFREVDLWKSFVHVDVVFVEGLDRYWLGYERPEETGDIRGRSLLSTRLKAERFWD
ncbi:hypothetical protein OQA88_10015 [Cercophora sp. LCS_1]